MMIDTTALAIVGVVFGIPFVGFTAITLLDRAYGAYLTRRNRRRMARNILDRYRYTPRRSKR